MKFSLFAVATLLQAAGSSAECCLTSESSCPEGYELVNGMSIGGKILCSHNVNGTSVECGSTDLEDTSKTCEGDEATSSAGKIVVGMNVWFVATAAAAFAGTN